MKYVAYKDSKAFMKDFKRVYGAESEEIAPYRDWGETYGQFVIEFGDRAFIA